MIEIKLDLYDLFAASQTGLTRVFESLRLKQDWGHNYKGSVNDQIAKSISGACAELAVCRYLNTAFNFHVNHGANPDVMFGDVRCQVRSQLPKKHNSLIIRPKGSKAGEMYILVIDKSPTFEIKGFVNSSYVLNTTKYLTDFGITDRPEVHSVPIDKLTPINFFERWSMELDMYGDPVKDCCIKDCKASAVIIEKGKSYCPDHYAEKVLKMSLTAVGRFIAEKENTNEFA